jgi:ATP-dependent DNA helicase DinG
MKGISDIFGPEGVIARHHPQYEYRPGQIQMAEAVARAIETGRHLLVEAGTGTGKTLAYLVPALASSERVIISTGTKTLQEQLYLKDLPFLEKALGRTLRVSYMKGRSNYVCLHRVKNAERVPLLVDLDETDSFEAVRRWACQSETGDRAELSDLPENLSFWSAIDARSEVCLGQKCPEYEACFITKMRERAAKADVVIVNHHLFFVDLALRGHEYGSIIPDYSVVIFDEAHELEDIASEYFGAQVSTYRIAELIRDAQALPLTDATLIKEVTTVCHRLQQRAERFWMNFQVATAMTDGRSLLHPLLRREETAGGPDPVSEAKDAAVGRLTSLGESAADLLHTLARLETLLASVSSAPPEVDAFVRRTAQLRRDLEFILSGADPRFVYWYERRGRNIFLQATPIDVSEILAERLFDHVPTAILTSATLTSGASFAYIKSRLGIRSADELIIPSHFDYSRQAILYLPPDMPDPRDPAFVDAAVREIVKILDISRGRAFVLCTSVAQMNDIYQRVKPRVTFPCFVQGEGSKAGLLHRFRTTPHSVLFATASFWQGVDVQGEALSAVIIDRLPFAVPTDPVIAARARSIEEMGGNAFYEYSVPQAVIMLKQGLGRLIRSRRDVGVLSVLDPRIRTKNYGSIFLESLPPCPITTRIEEIARVFDSVHPDEARR